jgi:hypothetical protein
MKLGLHDYLDLKHYETSIGGEKFHFIIQTTNETVKRNTIKCYETPT